jgi:hypothetical protein
LSGNIAGYAEYVINTGSGRASSDTEYAIAALRTGQNPEPNWEAKLLACVKLASDRPVARPVCE